MKSYVYIIIVFIVSLLYLQLLNYLEISLWLSLIVDAPVLFYLFIYSTVRYSFRDSLDYKDIPDKGYDVRRSALNKNVYKFHAIGFKKFDEFYLQIVNDVVVYVYYHSELPVIACDYHFGNLNYSELVSSFSNGYMVTTSNAADSGLIPRDKKKMLQICPDQKFNELLKQHKKTLEFLSSKSFKLSPLRTEYFRRWFLDEFKKAGDPLKNGLSPIKLYFWTKTKNKRKYIKSIQEQFLAKTQQLP